MEASKQTSMPQTQYHFVKERLTENLLIFFAPWVEANKQACPKLNTIL
jgi:hypothetical protein